MGRSRALYDHAKSEGSDVRDTVLSDRQKHKPEKQKGNTMFATPRKAKSITVLILAAATLLFLGACSQSSTPAADERAERLTGYFNDADLNSNGFIERSEIDAAADADFDALDYNNDGVVTIEDIYNEEQGYPEDFDEFERVTDVSHHLPYDLDGNNTITRAEYRSYLETELIAKMDTDKDGRISFAEYRAYENF